MNPLPKLAFIAYLFLAGCGPRLAINGVDYDKITVPSDDRSWPQLNTATTVQVGESMIKLYNVSVIPGVTLASRIRHIAKYREAERMALDLPTGTYLFDATDGSGGRYFKAPSSILLAYELKNRFENGEPLAGGLHQTRAGKWSVYWFWPEWKQAVLSPIAEVTLGSTTVESPPTIAKFRRELVYSGTSQSTLSIVYREFLGDMARPAFTQELRYDFSRGSVIGYKGARFEVIGVDNTSITYRVLAPLAQD